MYMAILQIMEILILILITSAIWSFSAVLMAIALISFEQDMKQKLF